MGLQQDFQESQTYELLEPYLDEHGLLAGYRIEGLVAKEAWRHTTYEAVTPDGGRVGLKLLGMRSDQTRRFTKRLQRLLRLRAAVKHPHLLPVLDWGEVGDRLYLAMPLSRAPTLAGLLAAAPLKTKGALRLLGQVADGLEAAHERGLVHRDLEPDRLLVEPRDGGHVMLGDFGVGDPEWSVGMLDQPSSTPYLSPEKVRGEPLTAESNVYSLACILVECLTGRPPYQSEHAGVVAYAHVAEPPPRIADEHSELPPALDDLLAAAMAKDPAERLASPRRLVDLASGALGLSAGTGTGGRGAAPPDLPPAAKDVADEETLERPRPRTDRDADHDARSETATRVVAAGAAATVALGVLGFALGRSGDDENGPAPPSAADVAQRSELQSTARAVDGLDARRAVLRQRLAAARSPAAQATHANELAGAYRRARQTLPAGTSERAGLGRALGQAEGAYRQLAGAAGRASRGSYAPALRSVDRAEGEVGLAIRRLAAG